MKTNEKVRIIPISVFKKAAINHFKCKPEDIETRIITENKEAFVEYAGMGYKISTYEALREDIAIQLTDKHAVHDIDLGCWINSTKHTIRINRILGDLIRTVENTEQAKKLLIAVGLGAYTEDADVAFWEILARIDAGGDVLGNAIITAAQVYNGPGLIDDIVGIQIMHGLNVYNKIVGGVFETVYVDAQPGTFEFYLYSAEYYFTD
jgi:hypothetical protein